MPEEKPEEKKEAGTETPVEKTYSEAEMQALKAKADQLDTLNQKVEGLYFDDVEQLINEFEEQIAREAESVGDNQPGSKPAPAPAAAPPKPEGKLSPELTELQNTVSKQNRQIAMAVLDSQYNIYEAGQEKLPETDRDGSSREEMWKLISDRQEAGNVERLANKRFGGNLWKAAGFMLSLDKKAEDYARRGAEAAEARKKAEASAQPGEGVSLPEKDKKEDTLKGYVDFIAPPNPT